VISTCEVEKTHHGFFYEISRAALRRTVCDTSGFCRCGIPWLWKPQAVKRPKGQPVDLQNDAYALSLM
jgi:hypothetical protein